MVVDIYLDIDVEHIEVKVEYVTALTNTNILVIPSRTSDPINPITGQVWLRTDIAS